MQRIALVSTEFISSDTNPMHQRGGGEWLLLLRWQGREFCHWGRVIPLDWRRTQTLVPRAWRVNRTSGWLSSMDPGREKEVLFRFRNNWSWTINKAVWSFPPSAQELMKHINIYRLWIWFALNLWPMFSRLAETCWVHSLILLFLTETSWFDPSVCSETLICFYIFTLLPSPIFSFVGNLFAHLYVFSCCSVIGWLGTYTNGPMGDEFFLGMHVCIKTSSNPLHEPLQIIQWKCVIFLFKEARIMSF